MAKGANAKYKIPEFIPCAGPSPNCCAVLVQIEHCAHPAAREQKKNPVKSSFFILLLKQKYEAIVSSLLN
jgi:hypothetical protein